MTQIKHDDHGRTLSLPKPGSMKQLETLAARLHSMLLDRSRPLYEFYVIDGSADAPDAHKLGRLPQRAMENLRVPSRPAAAAPAKPAKARAVTARAGNRA